MPALACSVSGCYKSAESKHRFPHPDKISKTMFERWVNLCGNKRLKEEMTPKKIYTNCRVCALHFLPDDFGPNRVLKRGVFPSVNLPEPLEPIINEIPEPLEQIINEIPSPPPTTSSEPHSGTVSPLTLKLQESLRAQFVKARARASNSVELSPDVSHGSSSMASAALIASPHTNSLITYTAKKRKAVSEVPLPIVIKEEPIQNEDMLEHIQMDLSDKNNTGIKSEPNCDEIVDKEFAEQCLEYTLKFLKQCSSSDVRQEIQMLEKLKNRWPQLK